MTLIHDIKSIPSTKKDLQNYAMVMGVALGILGSILLWYEKPSALAILVISFFFAIIGLICPGLLKPVQKAWMTLAILLSWVMTRILMSLLFYLVLTPLSLVMRLFGHKFLEQDWKKETKSFWIPRPEEKFDPKHTERQF